MVNFRKKKIIFVVCHPDDEALWIGGLLSCLEKLPTINLSVICLSGGAESSIRANEFFAAKEVAGYSQGIVLGEGLRSSDKALPYTPDSLEKGLVALKIDQNEIDLVITHSPFGDEHIHPHHQQAYREIYLWAKANNLPFGFFSCMPIPIGSLSPVLTNMRRFGALQVLNLSKCSFSLIESLSFMLWKGVYKTPKFYIQFLTDLALKTVMLNCYQSVNVEQHKDGYAMWTNNCESLYLHDEKGLDVFLQIIDEMDIPGPKNIFLSFPLFGIRVKIVNKITKFFKNAINN